MPMMPNFQMNPQLYNQFLAFQQFYLNNVMKTQGQVGGQSQVPFQMSNIVKQPDSNLPLIQNNCNAPSNDFKPLTQQQLQQPPQQRITFYPLQDKKLDQQNDYRYDQKPSYNFEREKVTV